MRLFSFTNNSLPQAFAYVLMFYLLGIAIGAKIGKRFCTGSYNLWLVSGVVLVLASFFDFVSPWIYAQLAHTTLQVKIGGLLILLTAFGKAILFPIAHHLGVNKSPVHVGGTISKVYVANIIGATVGPIFTTLVLLNFFTTQHCFALVALVTFLGGIFCLIYCVSRMILTLGTLMITIFFCFIVTREPSLLISKVANLAGQIRQIVETRQGIVVIYKGIQGDIVYGGNVYDGNTNLNPLINLNYLNRLIILSVLEKKPARILVIGLSIGTWLKIMTSFPGVQSIDVVEINPGYLEAIKNYPRQQSALQDPRVHLYIDDGRRWIKHHSAYQYDLIIMNTTFSWRAYTTNLLSREFLNSLKQHMKQHAILAYNTTGSPDVFKTTAQIFPFAYLYQNFVIAADFDWRGKLLEPDAIKKLSDLMLDGKPLFDKSDQTFIKMILHIPTISLQKVESHYILAGQRLEIITDRNLITEYKYGRQLQL